MIKWPKTIADEGGPAYPQPDWPGEPWDADEHGSAIGMSMRDRFAIAALTGLLASGKPSSNGWVAQQAFEIADAMLAERARKPEDAEE